MSNFVWEVDRLSVGAVPIYDLDLQKDISVFVWDNGVTKLKGDRIILPPTEIKDDQEREAIKKAMEASVEPITGIKTYMHTYYANTEGKPICHIILGEKGTSVEYFTIFVSREIKQNEKNIDRG
jgi:hypothetical protein